MTNTACMCNRRTGDQWRLPFAPLPVYPKKLSLDRRFCCYKAIAAVTGVCITCSWRQPLSSAISGRVCMYTKKTVLRSRHRAVVNNMWKCLNIAADDTKVIVCRTPVFNGRQNSELCETGARVKNTDVEGCRNPVIKVGSLTKKGLQWTTDNALQMHDIPIQIIHCRHVPGQYFF